MKCHRKVKGKSTWDESVSFVGSQDQAGDASEMLGTKTAAERINWQGCFRAEMLYSEFLQEVLFVVN